MPKPREWTFERHHFRLESPGVLWMRVVGLCSLEDAKKLIALFQEVCAVHPVLLLADMGEEKGMDSDARRYLSEHVQSPWFRAIIFYKTRLLTRATARGVSLAAQFFRPEGAPPPTPMHFVPTREDAVKLLEQLRARDFKQCA